MNEQTEKQVERQKYRDGGKYAKVNPCYVCGKSAGVDYCSHPDTDGEINDELLVMCAKCSKKLSNLPGKEAVKIAFPNEVKEKMNKTNWSDTLTKTHIERGEYGRSKYEEIAEYKLVKVIRRNKPYNDSEVMFEAES